MLTMRMDILLKRSIGRGFQTLLRERQWLTALGALLGVFVLVQLLLVVLLGLEGMQSLLRERIDVRLEIRSETTDAQVQEFYSALNEQPFVLDTLYITKEKAYEEAQQTDPELVAFLEEYDIENPFRDSIGVTLRSLQHFDAFTGFIGQERWNSVITTAFLSQMSKQESEVYALLRITGAGRSLITLILTIAITALLLVTTELIRRRSVHRSDEVLVERLVGASSVGIALPFITEACILLSVAILTSAGILLLTIVLLPVLIPELQTGGVLDPLTREVLPLFGKKLPLYIAMQILLTPVLATLGTYMGMYRQLRSPRISLST